MNYLIEYDCVSRYHSATALTVHNLMPKATLKTMLYHHHNIVKSAVGWSSGISSQVIFCLRCTFAEWNLSCFTCQVFWMLNRFYVNQFLRDGRIWSCKRREWRFLQPMLKVAFFQLNNKNLKIELSKWRSLNNGPLVTVHTSFSTLQQFGLFW